MFRFLTRAVLLRVLGRRFVPFMVVFEVLRSIDRLRRPQHVGPREPQVGPREPEVGPRDPQPGRPEPKDVTPRELR